MPIIYDRLFKMLDKKDIKISEFRYNKILSSATIAKLRKNQPVNISVLDMLCEKLNCDLDDIAEYRPTNYSMVSDETESDNLFIFTDEANDSQLEELPPESAVKEVSLSVDDDPYITSVSGIDYKKSKLEYDRMHHPHKFIANKTYPHICTETGYAYLKNELCVIERPDNPDQ